jgi:hypothetical protein
MVVGFEHQRPDPHRSGDTQGTETMEAVNVAIGPLVFDHADYDSEGDILYLHVGAPQDAEAEETRRAMFCALSRAPSA